MNSALSPEMLALIDTLAQIEVSTYLHASASNDAAHSERDPNHPDTNRTQEAA